MVVRVIWEYGFDVPKKTPGLYHVSKLSNLNYLFKILLNLSKFVKKLIKKKVSTYLWIKSGSFGIFPIDPTYV